MTRSKCHRINCEIRIMLKMITRTRQSMKWQRSFVWKRMNENKIANHFEWAHWIEIRATCDLVAVLFLYSSIHSSLWARRSIRSPSGHTVHGSSNRLAAGGNRQFLLLSFIERAWRCHSNCWSTANDRRDHHLMVIWWYAILKKVTNKWQKLMTNWCELQSMNYFENREFF